MIPALAARPTDAAAPKSIAVRNLRVVIAGSATDVVDEVGFDLVPGEILGLVGESGSGKTTVGLALLKHCRRGLAIAGGSVLIAGQDLLGLPEAAVNDLRGELVCYVPQDPGTALNPGLRIRTQMSECLRGPAEDREAALLNLLAELKLPATPAFLDAYPHQMSGGQQQRIAIAMAFANRPRLIVMDEPTTGLDVTTQAHVLETVRQLCARHDVAAVYVSHDLAVIASLATRVAVMYAGRIVEMGPTAEVLHRPVHPYTRALIRAVPDLDGSLRLQGIPGQAPDPGRRPVGCSFAPRCPLAIEACRKAPPSFMSVATGHEVRCIRSGEQERAASTAAVLPESTAATEAPLFRTGNLRAFHGAKEVLHGITLDLPAHSCLALVGESGSGKTTLARCIAGLHRELDGVMEFRGAPIAAGARRRSADTRRRIQYIFQNPYASLNPRRSVGDSVAIALHEFEPVSGRAARDRVARALERVALPARTAERFPHQLSGGQRQRAAIARALIAEPLLLVCDEVTSALDVSVQAVIVELLGQLQQEQGLTMLFVTHNLALVRSIAQQVAVMQSGRIVELGAVRAVLERPQAEETRRLLTDAPRFSPQPAS